MQQKNIHWFPGHMVKALREIKEKINLVDVVVEIVDSRCPISSKNPFLDEIINNKEKMIVFSKKDLCDDVKINIFKKLYNEKGYEVVIADLNDKNDISKIISTINHLGKGKQEKYIKRGMKPQPLKIMIIGIPNVGKSTLINRLVKKNAASTRNTPGHTRAQQWVRINQNFDLLDTPGILPPHYEDKVTSTNLAIIGSIKDDILPLDEVFTSLFDFLVEKYKDEFYKKYSIEKDASEAEIVQYIGQNRGMLLKGGIVDTDAVKKMIIKEFRGGLIAKVVVDEVC